jgi:hypothetical protein
MLMYLITNLNVSVEQYIILNIFRVDNDIFIA